VVTYNFDDFLEQRLAQDGVRSRAICGDVENPSRRELGIYHVHGYLPQFECAAAFPRTPLVFSEEAYHDLYLNAFSRANGCQVNYLRTNTVLMIGISGTDPNLRRLLDVAFSGQSKPRHFIVMKREKLKVPPHYQDGAPFKEVLDAFSPIHYRLQESSFAGLGLNVIWVDEFDEIPAVLDRIRGGAG
jgi:hypothetical protein